MRKLLEKIKHINTASILVFTVLWVALAFLLPISGLWSFFTNLIISVLAAFLTSKIVDSSKKKKSKKEHEEMISEMLKTTQRTSGSPEIDAVLSESEKALAEMGRIYASINDTNIKAKINELMLVTDKIAQDAVADPSDLPQIKKFFSYYLPTTIKLLNAYDRMGSQTIQGENIEKSMKSIDEMLDTTIDAYKKRLDSLFENQAMDIETDIDVMNTMLAREGLSGDKDF